MNKYELIKGVLSQLDDVFARNGLKILEKGTYSSSSHHGDYIGEVVYADIENSAQRISIYVYSSDKSIEHIIEKFENKIDEEIFQKPPRHQDREFRLVFEEASTRAPGGYIFSPRSREDVKHDEWSTTVFFHLIDEPECKYVLDTVKLKEHWDKYIDGSRKIGEDIEAYMGGGATMSSTRNLRRPFHFDENTKIIVSAMVNNGPEGTLN